MVANLALYYPTMLCQGRAVRPADAALLAEWWRCGFPQIRGTLERGFGEGPYNNKVEFLAVSLLALPHQGKLQGEKGGSRCSQSLKLRMAPTMEAVSVLH